MSSHEGYRINSPNVVFEKFDDEIVIINLSSCIYYSLDKIGANIWSLISSGAAVSEIVGWIANRHGNSSLNEVEDAIYQFLAALEKEDLIVPDEVQEDEGEKQADMEVKISSRTEKSMFEKPVLQKYTDMQHFLSVDMIQQVDSTDWSYQ